MRRSFLQALLALVGISGLGQPASAQERVGPSDAAVLMEVNPDVLMRRLTGRRTCSVTGKVLNVYFSPPSEIDECRAAGGELLQRDDDREETVRKRLEVYRAQTRPLIEYYAKWAASGDARAPRCRKISGTGKVDEIGRRALDALR